MDGAGISEAAARVLDMLDSGDTLWGKGSLAGVNLDLSPHRRQVNCALGLLSRGLTGAPSVPGYDWEGTPWEPAVRKLAGILRALYPDRDRSALDPDDDVEGVITAINDHEDTIEEHIRAAFEKLRAG